MKIDVRILPPEEKRWSEMNKREKATRIATVVSAIVVITIGVSRAK